MSDGMKCHGCGDTHQDWTEVADVPCGPDSPAMQKVWECGSCGAETEVPYL